MSKTKIQSSKNKLVRIYFTSEGRGQIERLSPSHLTSTSTTKKTARSKKLSSNTRLDSNIVNINGNGISQILRLKEMELADIGEYQTKNTGLCVALDVYANSSLTGQKILIPLDAALFVSTVTKNLLAKRGVSVDGL